MNRWTLLRHQWRLSLFYFTAAAVAIWLTRLEGGVAQLWGASAILFAALMRTRPAHWWAPVAACVLPGALATGLFGLGWSAAPIFAAINAGEAIIAALVLRRLHGRGETLANLRWFAAFVAACVAGPLLLTPVVGSVMWLLGHDPLAAMLYYLSGHALGNLIFTPLALMLVGSRARAEVFATVAANRGAVIGVLALAVGTSLVVFGQSSFPILYLASMSAVLATFWLGRMGAALSVVVLALGGTIAKVLNSGPLQLTDLGTSGKLLMLQVFLAATTLTVLPVAAALRARKALLARVRESEARFRMLADHSSDIILHLGVEGQFKFVSPSITRLSGHDAEQLIGRPAGEFVHPEDRGQVATEHRACFEQPGETRRFRHRARVADGGWRWVEANACAILDEAGKPEGVVSMLRDITDAKAEEDRWQAAALTDRLTGLPNRRALEEACAGGVPGQHCLALLDLDRFKLVNDTYGHDAGDAVLQGFAEVARRLVRNHDLVARLGGEEFVILFRNTSIDQAYQVCERMRRVVGATPLATPAGPLRVTASGGVAVIGKGGLETALKAADEALYRAKRAGRDQLLLAA